MNEGLRAMLIYLFLPIFCLAELYSDFRLLRITKMLFWEYPEIYKSLGFKENENAFVRSIKMNYRLVYSMRTKELPMAVRLELLLFAFWRPIAILYFFVLLYDKKSA